MKNKFLNLIALVAMALCFSTFALAETKTNLPADNSASVSVNIVQTENTTAASPTTGINLNDFISMTADSQNENSAASSTTDDGQDAAANSNDLEIVFDIRSDWRIERLNNKTKRLYFSSARAINARPPNKFSRAFGRAGYERQDSLRFTFDAVNNSRQRR